MLRQSGKIQQPILPLLRRFLQITKKEIYCHIPLRMTSVKAFNTKTHSAKSASETCQTVNEVRHEIMFEKLLLQTFSRSKNCYDI